MKAMVVACALLLGALTATAEPTEQQLVTRYEHAAQYLPWMIKKSVFGMRIQPQWRSDGKSLRYRWDTPAGDVYYEVSLAAGAKKRVLHQKPVPSVVNTDSAAKDVFASPNRQWGAKVIEGNLYRVELASGRQTQLTFDAEPDYGYGLEPQWTSASLTTRLAGTPLLPFGIRSPEGHRFLTYRVDERGMYKLPHVVAVVPGAKHQVPYVHFQNMAWPDSEKRQEAELMVFDMRTGKRTNLEIPKPGVGYGPTPEGGTAVERRRYESFRSAGDARLPIHHAL